MAAERLSRDQIQQSNRKNLVDALDHVVVIGPALSEVAAEVLVERREDPGRDDVVVGAQAVLGRWHARRHFADFVDHRRRLDDVQQVGAQWLHAAVQLLVFDPDLLHLLGKLPRRLLLSRICRVAADTGLDLRIFTELECWARQPVYKKQAQR